MNLPIIMEFLGQRNDIDIKTFDFNSLIDTGRNALGRCELNTPDDELL